MSGEFEEPAGGAADEPQSAGARLKAAREAQGLRVETAAEALGVGRATIVALENDDYARLGAPVFVRGYLRKYAAYLDLSGDELIAWYERSSAPRDPELKTHLSPVSPRRRSGGRWVAIVMILILIAILVVAGIWVWHYMRAMHQTTRIPPAAAAAATSLYAQHGSSKPVRRKVTTAFATAARTAASSAAPLAASARVAVPVATGTAQTAAGGAAPASAQPQLVLQVHDTCWIEVKAADQTRLYYDLAPAGKTLHFDDKHGKLTVFLGNTKGVTVTVNGRPFSIPASTRSGDTARFEVALAKASQPATSTPTQ